MAFSIEQRQFLTCILTDEATSTRLEVVPERGGIITRWQVQGQDILYLDEARFADPSLSVRGGIPILFPICGNLPNNTYTHQGKSYLMKQHGFARDLPWTVVNPSPADAIQLVLSSSNLTRSQYPFDFELRFTYRLLPNRLRIEQQITSRSAEPMPFSIGFHPYFPVNDKAQLQFEIPAIAYQDQQTQTVHPFSGQFDFDRDEIDVAFRQISRESASVADAARRIDLTLAYDPLFSTLVFWTVKGKDYYCLEPWSAPRNALNTRDSLTLLPPCDRLETAIELSVAFR
ncbi:aldose epimerase [Leptolyngbya sp. FACHB-711]|uniref:aldose epimerase family protein n=1 Tax=unclassified Leptolyngbya TaxID=2650499 RepID=UPI001687FF5F|nr:aldose epimerase [Leptolyngbya sp. FACHB-711]MBD1849543.1 aldose epimerase [Cyanobacteria bacterium FACHB-502]MBD2024902.1 aldose epimerase [Leptolyngbya sp. FACHB-711]